MSAKLVRAAASLSRRGPAARRARKILIDAGNQGDVAAVDAIFLGAVDRIGLYYGRKAANREVAQAYFYAITNQMDTLQALDPDWALLAEAYAQLPTGFKAELLGVLVGNGQLTAVRALTLERRQGDLSEEEFHDLARGLADEREWAQLWRLVRDAPLARALASMSLFGDWRPPETGLFDLLATTDPEVITSLGEPVLHLPKASGSASFALDSSEIAIGDADWVAVYSLPDGKLVQRYSTNTRWKRDVVALGGGAVVYTDDSDSDEQFVWYRSGKQRKLTVRARMPKAARTPDGVVIKTDRSLVFDTFPGRALTKVQVTTLGIQTWIVDVATDPASGRVALLAGRSGNEMQLLVLDANRVVVARTVISDDVMDCVRMCGPDRLITWDKLGYTHLLWRLEGAALVPAGSSRVTVGYRENLAIPPVPLPGSTKVANQLGSHSLYWFDFDRLDRDMVGGPVGFRPDDGLLVCFSPEGRYAAHFGKTAVVVRDLPRSELVELVAQPVSVETFPVQRGRITALESQNLGDHDRKVLGLLRDRLAYRFRDEIAIGTTHTVAGEDDIALGSG